MIAFSTRSLNTGWIWIIFVQIIGVQSLICYTCDSSVDKSCLVYPTPTSAYEDCDERPMKTYQEHLEAISAHAAPPPPPRKEPVVESDAETEEQEDSQTIYIHYRYKLCPLMEGTIKHTVPKGVCSGEETNKGVAAFESALTPLPDDHFPPPNPMENATYVCGKAVTHDNHHVLRVRRGCTPDLFLSGTDACVSASPGSRANIVCFCTVNFCNHGSSPFYHRQTHNFLIVFLFLPLTVNIVY